MDKLPSMIIYYLASTFLASRLRSVGISNLPVAFQQWRQTLSSKRRPDGSLDVVSCAKELFQTLYHSLVVVSGVWNIYPLVIQWHAVWNIILAVKESIDQRNLEKLLEAEKKKKNDDANDETTTTTDKSARSRRTSMTQIMKGWLLLDNNNDNHVEKKAVEKNADQGNKALITKSSNSIRSQKSQDQAQKAAQKAKQLLAGKGRDSATDDICWGIMQICFVWLNSTTLQAVGTAWMIFLLTVMEEAVFNPKLTKNQKIRKACWILAVAYGSGKLVFF